MNQSIPLKPTPSQSLNVTLGNQACTLNVYQLGSHLFIDILVNDAVVLSGIVCRNRVKIVRDSYLGFMGDLAFVDTQGWNNPDYTGLGDRYVLFYLT